MSAAEGRLRGRPPATANGRTVPERLPDAAREVFAEKGFDGTSVQDVVRATEVTKGAVYRCFPSKDDLLHEICLRVLRMQNERLDAVVTTDLPVAERVHAAVVDVVGTTLENLRSTTIFFRPLHRLAEENQRQVRRERGPYRETFRALVVGGQREGVFRDDVGAEPAVDYCFGSVRHLPMGWRSEGGASADEVARAFADLFPADIAGIAAR
ncbi:TetR/AcrR family transcriptional regulator [Streptomyces sp. NPDC004266]|uniref:TetR/AcrR family transcriptional regulator n=1 Tax=Streptomyces sp. NPDC004266 TaxID=3364693 RepID=UPI0036B7F763